MLRLRMIALLVFAVLLNACTQIPPPNALAPAEAKAFGALSTLVGTTWKSTGDDGDVSQWSADLGGRVLVSRHALADGSYGGVTYIYRNAKSGSIDYVYATSAGFHTSGTFVLNPDGSWTSEEAVTGHASITRVRATGRIDADGRLLSVSEYFANGAWTPGRNAVYAPYDGPVPEVTRTPE